MALTSEQTQYVSELESLIQGMRAHANRAARSLLEAKKGITEKQAADPSAFEAAYGDSTTAGTAAADLTGELGELDTAVDALFSSGLVTGTRKEMEDSLSPLTPPG